MLKDNLWGRGCMTSFPPHGITPETFGCIPPFRSVSDPLFLYGPLSSVPWSHIGLLCFLGLRVMGRVIVQHCDRNQSTSHGAPAHAALPVGLAAAPLAPHTCPSALRRHVHHVRKRPLHLRKLSLNDGPLELGHRHVRIPHTKAFRCRVSVPGSVSHNQGAHCRTPIRIRLDSRNCKAS